MHANLHSIRHVLYLMQVFMCIYMYAYIYPWLQYFGFGLADVGEERHVRKQNRLVLWYVEERTFSQRQSSIPKLASAFLLLRKHSNSVV